MNERPPRRLGRPPLDTRYPSVPISTRITAPEYDELCKRAQRDRVSVADVVRQRLQRDDDD